MSAVLTELRTDLHTGLSADEAAKRLGVYGRNQLAEHAGRSVGRMLLDQFRDVMIWVLLAAVLISASLGELVDAVVIALIVVLNAALGVVQEHKAERSLAALKRLAAPRAHVIRDGSPIEIAAAEIVPGDLALLEAGNLVPADLRLIETASLRIEEATLTGESVPVQKDAAALLAPESPTGDRVNLAYAGTTVVVGRGRGLVFATGAQTQVGEIAHLLGDVSAEKTPLQERLEGLGRQLALLVLGVCLVVLLAGWLRGVPFLELFLTSVSLAVAAIPEGLPAVVTIVLALGMSQMVRRNVIVRRLQAVEALGSTTVICSDKTGTLTQNRMMVRRVWTCGFQATVTGSGYSPEGAFLDNDEPVVPTGHAGILRMLEVAALCNDAHLSQGGAELTGDPTEGALLAMVDKAGLSHVRIRHSFPRRSEVPFDSDRKRMSTVHALEGEAGHFRIAVKGAPGPVLETCTHILDRNGPRTLTPEDRKRILGVATEHAEQALRVLAFAFRDTPSLPAEAEAEAVERDLVFCGIVGMLDPPREEAREAVATCRRAGIKPVMITGDHAVTATAIARELGIAETGSQVLTGGEISRLTDAELADRVSSVSVYARVSPADKLRIVNAYRSRKEIVAMTGDGVNDAPALKRSDIGVAMGLTGTDVAKGAADIVLTDDNFASIVAAVEEGRRIFDNIRKFVFYLLSCNISEVLTIFLAIMAGLPQPLLPVQILWVNLVTDGLPALALGLEPREAGVMQRPPRDPHEGVLTRRTVRGILWYGFAITAASLGAYVYGLYRYCLEPSGFSGLGSVGQALQPSFWTTEIARHGLAYARTLAFGTLAFSQLAHALNSRSETVSLFRMKLAANPPLLYAIAVSVLAQFAVIYIPFLNHVFGTVPIGGVDVLVGTALSLSPILFGEIRKALLNRAFGQSPAKPPNELAGRGGH